MSCLKTCALAFVRTGLPVWFMILVLAAGCGGDGGTDPGPTAASLTAEGWTAFEAGDSVTADARFRDALALDADYADAYTGLGWVAIRQEEYASATSHFGSALTRSSSALDARAGQVLAEAGLDHPQTVRDMGQEVLAAQPDYSFRHDPTYSATDVRWLVARAALDMGDYSSAATHLAALTTAPVPDPEAAGFLEAALALLEDLRNQV